MKIRGGRERGQAMVEFALISIPLFILTVGLIDAGRAFYEYNALSSAARFGARWGAVAGGTCDINASASNDWCNQIGRYATGSTYTPFWLQSGNQPIQASPNTCPTSMVATAPYTSQVSSYQVSGALDSSLGGGALGGSGHPTSIVGAIAQRFDSTNSSATGVSSIVAGVLLPAFDLTKLQVCIELNERAWDSGSSKWIPRIGDVVKVYVYYHFTPAGGLLPMEDKINLVASAQYEIE